MGGASQFRWNQLKPNTSAIMESDNNKHMGGVGGNRSKDMYQSKGSMERERYGKSLLHFW